MGSTGARLCVPMAPRVRKRHPPNKYLCPLYPQKRTLELSREMSALCQKADIGHQLYAVTTTPRSLTPLRPNLVALPAARLLN